MKIQELLEAVGGDIIYHSVRSGKTAQQILKSGVIKPFVGDEDEQFFNQELPVISASRSQYYRFPYGDGIVQFVLDRSALKKAGFKVEPFNSPSYSHKFEAEERIWHPKGIGIPVKTPFVKGIQIDPEIEAVKSFITLAKKMGIPVSAMKGFKKSDSNNSQTNKLDPNLSDPTKYDLEKKEWFGDTVYTIFYNSGGGHSILIQPFYLMKDEQFAKQVFKQIVDRVKQGKGYDDIKNANIKYAKSWEKGRHELPPGN